MTWPARQCERGGDRTRKCAQQKQDRPKPKGGVSQTKIASIPCARRCVQVAGPVRGQVVPEARWQRARKVQISTGSTHCTLYIFFLTPFAPPKFPHAPGGPAAGLVAADTLYSAQRSTRETGIVCLAYSATSFGKPAAHFPSLLSVSRRGSPWSSLRSVQRPAGKEVEKKKKRRLSRYLNPRRAGNEPFY